MTQLRVRARAVDMLGRQQIAGIPTAIHELFKNAHDAYADRVEVDFYRRTRVLVLRDDGYGMTREDLENRWLTIGTESRVKANSTANTDEWRGLRNPPKRIIMGEKGIGRLAIAVIAPVTLLMTRAARPDGLHNLIVTLVHWGLFEQPGIDISAIDIPIKEIPGGTLPSNSDIITLANHVAANLASLQPDIAPEAYDTLCRDLDRVRTISPDILDTTLNRDREKPLSLSGDGYGTHFIVLPVASELDDDIDGGADKDASKLERNLLGFSNYMSDQLPVITTEFRDHNGSEPRSLIGPNEFFSNNDFEKTDQFFEGTFDANGQFTGTVSIYGKSRPFVCNWLDGRGRQPRCGSFYFKYGYVQGAQKDSKLSSESWIDITKKLDRLGGLYIYRDSIRMLPYGNSDIDWLDIEKRRTKSAGDWFFSYRRGFGYVEISHEHNSALSEKAGREGFRENQAYRDFRSILINFYQQLAYEFFRETSPQGDFWDVKKELDLQSKLLEKQRKKAEGRRGELKKQLDVFFKNYENNFFENENKKVRSYIEESIANLTNIHSLGDLALKLRNLDAEVRAQYRKLASASIILAPKGLSLGKSLERDWNAYLNTSATLKAEILDPLRVHIDQQLHNATEGHIAEAQRIENALQDIEKERTESVKALSSLRRAALMASDNMQKTLRITLQDEFAGLRVSMENLVGDFTKRTAENPAYLDEVRHDIENAMSALSEEEASLLDAFRRQMDELTEGITARETLDDRFAALENRNQQLEEQLDFYTEFAQMGMAVGILQHEFERAANGIRVALNDLRPWADRNPPLALIYKPLRTHIEHLDDYLKAIDPLGRRLYRSTVTLSGEEILSAVRRIFSLTLEEAKIELVPTSAFRELKIDCKPPAIIGAFVNIIDNAIYWIDSRAQGERKVVLDADGQDLLISNTGPGIEERMKEQIFDFGVTKKPGGRGMGLAVSRNALHREGFELELAQAGLDTHPIFRISAKEQVSEK
ncbi:ATP-binding protein [Dechloromonas denitrificans]|uniref:ATP-binding protein n=1 Tax=Dechloromonas denitrificans TaxID=281362 RepID=UPI001CF90D2C|nr:ATP-binding protein [Dechloromonas denitrificans]UCV11315.1 ATP-binding protein [Dechloromonas denitrificans]